MAREETVEATATVASKAPFLGHAKGEEFTAELTPSQWQRAVDRGNIVLDSDIPEVVQPDQAEQPEPDPLEEEELLPPAHDNDEQED